MNLLFVTWDGVQSNYLENLFLPILTRLNAEVTVLQFSWADESRTNLNAELCKNEGIDYHHIKIRRNISIALGSLVTAYLGSFKIRGIIKSKDIDIVISRSNLPSFSTMLALKNVNNKVKFIFDADGLPIDERVDFGSINPTSINYRILRDIETQAIIRSDAIITRAGAGADILNARGGSACSSRKFVSVTNGRLDESEDSLLFGSNLKSDLGISNDDQLIVFAGTLSNKYCVDDMFRFYKILCEKRSNTRFLILTVQTDDAIELTKKHGLTLSNVKIKTVAHDEVKNYLAFADAGLVFIDRKFSTRAVSPIKLGEYLSSGIRVIASSNVLSDFNINKSLCYSLTDCSDSSLRDAADWFVNGLNENYDTEELRMLARKYFSLDKTVLGYEEAIKLASRTTISN